MQRKNTIKTIFNQNYKKFKNWALTNSYSSLRSTVDENVEKIISCKDPKKIGFHQYSCPNHPDNKTIIPHTCKSRSCSSCGALATNRWADSLNDCFPNKPYFHITFTIPKILSHFFFFNRKLIPLLFKATADTMLSWFWEKEKCIPAISCILHTAGRDIANWHVHIHMIISAGGLIPSKGIRSMDTSQTYKWKDVSFIPYKMISKRFRYLLLSALKPFLKIHYSSSKIDKLFEINWHTHCSGELDKSIVTIGYIGRYTKRPPIALSNVLDYDKKEDIVVYRFSETRSGINTTNQCSVNQFIQRFVQHIPKKHQKYIYHYGIMANRCKSFYQKKLFSLGLLFNNAKAKLSQMKYRLRKMIENNFDPMVCEKCGAQLILDAVVVKAGNGLTVKFIRSNQVVVG